MKETTGSETPISSSSSEERTPYVELMHEFAKEGKQVQDSLAMFGGVPVLLQFLSDYLHAHDSGVKEESAYIVVEAVASIALMLLGSNEGR